MSTTTTTEHPQTLRDQAFELYCSGLRSPAIAQQLAVPECTIRSWIAATCQQLSKERTGTAQAAAALAEARQLQIAAAAWQSYRRHAAAEQRQLDDLQFATRDELDDHPPRLSSGGARYLALALRATDLAAKLAGAYTCPPPQPASVEFILTQSYRSPAEIAPPHDQPQLSGLALERYRYRYQEYVRGLAAQCASDQEQLAKGRARLAELDARLTPQPTPSAADDGEDSEDFEDFDDPTDADAANTSDNPATDDAEADSPAESATASGSPLPAGRGVGGEVPSPAESATTPPPVSSSSLSSFSESAGVNSSPLRAPSILSFPPC